MHNRNLDTDELAWLAGLARALIREPHGAEDLVQDTLVAAMQGTVPGAELRRPWLASVARRLAARRYRSDARRDSRESQVARPESVLPTQELLERAETAELVSAALRRLPEPFRRTLLLRFIEGQAPGDIARREGLPPDTVRWRVRRGLQLLRESLGSQEGRDWQAWSVVLAPLAQTQAGRSAGVGATLLFSTASRSLILGVAFAALGVLGLWWALKGGAAPKGPNPADTTLAYQESSLEGESGVGPEVLAAPESQERSDGTAVARAARVEPAGPALPDLFGRVEDIYGDAVPSASVYLVPAAGTTGVLRVEGDLPLVKTNGAGRFWMRAGQWIQAVAPGVDPDRSLDLRVLANGFRGVTVPQVLTDPKDEGLRIVLEPGELLSGRVLDPEGQPVAKLSLLAHSAGAKVEHVSPSKVALRSEALAIRGVDAGFGQCRGQTDGRGLVRFSGLASGKIRVRSLDPGWVIRAADPVDSGARNVTWIAEPRLGVRVTLVDRDTGKVLPRASARFRVRLQPASGPEVDLGQWVGAGRGVVSFCLGPAYLGELEGSEIVRAVFYGTASFGEGAEVQWEAPALEGAQGVAEVQVTIDPEDMAPEAEEPGSEPQPAPPKARLLINAFYGDGTPLEDPLYVDWRSSLPGEGVRRGDRQLKAKAPSRYELEVPAGTIQLELTEAFASGSTVPWTQTVDCEPGSETILWATLQRGARATLLRPRAWSGEWYVHASWRPSAADEWRGSWTYSTTEDSLVLNSLAPALWRFRLRPEEDSQAGRQEIQQALKAGDDLSLSVD